MSLDRDAGLAELEALLERLVESADPEARRPVLKRLVEIVPFGHHPLLYVEALSDPLLRSRIRLQEAESLNDLKLRHDWKQLMSRPGVEPDLEQGICLISRIGGDFELTPEDIREHLNRLAVPLRERLSGVEGTERLRVFRRYVFREMGFRGNTSDYYAPENSFLHEVLRTRRGIPVSLGVACMLLARRVGLPIFGINMPGHFLLKYESPEFSVYLDPFNEGNLLRKRDCVKFLLRQKIRPSGSLLKPASSLTILKRMYRNLINYYVSHGASGMEKRLRRHFSILQKGFSPPA